MYVCLTDLGMAIVCEGGKKVYYYTNSGQDQKELVSNAKTLNVEQKKTTN